MGDCIGSHATRYRASDVTDTEEFRSTLQLGHKLRNLVLTQLLILWRLPVDRVHLERCTAERGRVVLHTSLSCFSYRRDTVEAQSADKGWIGQIWDLVRFGAMFLGILVPFALLTVRIERSKRDCSGNYRTALPAGA